MSSLFSASASFTTKQKVGLVLGPVLFIITLFFVKPAGMPEPAIAVLASALWIATWWFTEALPLAVTSLLPLVLFPLTGSMSIKAVAPPYADKIIFLFIGGFMLAFAIEKWDLHRRIALIIIKAIGTEQSRIIFGFMLATFLLSMWISNTATTMLMVPIALAVLGGFKMYYTDEKAFNNYEVALLLGIAYSASIGGLATKIGTPTNLIFFREIEDTFQHEITFSQWAMIGVPVAVLMLFVCWWFLTHVLFKMSTFKAKDSHKILDQYKLNPISTEEKLVLAVFTVVALGWISSGWLKANISKEINDSIIALTGGVALFIIPTKNDPRGRILNVNDINKLPWGIILLFGGGLALATGFKESGLAEWIGDSLAFLSGFHLLLIVFVITLVVNFLTEFTMNIATATMILPILAALAISLGYHPLLFMVAATIAASCAFMLPIATAPNAIVFGSDKIKMGQMVRAGIGLNIISVCIITILAYFLLPLVWDINIFEAAPPFDKIVTP